MHFYLEEIIEIALKHEHKDTKYRCVNNSQIKVPNREVAIITQYKVVCEIQKCPYLSQTKSHTDKHTFKQVCTQTWTHGADDTTSQVFLPMLVTYWCLRVVWHLVLLPHIFHAPYRRGSPLQTWVPGASSWLW